MQAKKKMKQPLRFQKMGPAQKYESYNRHFLNKRCVTCRLSSQEKSQFIFCDQCDDAYHWVCLSPPITSDQFSQENPWICPHCQDYLSKAQRKTVNMEKDCYKCKQSFVNHVKEVMIEAKVIINYQNPQKVKVLCKQKSILQCRYCQHWFHQQCFSTRLNSLNCWRCEQQIRSSCPKNYTQFVLYLQQCQQKVPKMNYLPLQDLDQCPELPKLQLIRLQTYSLLDSWQAIIRVYASLHYALSTSRQAYTSTQLYSTPAQMQLNQCVHNYQQIKVLAEQDQLVYEQFLWLLHRHYLPPLQIRQDRVKGFYVVAATDVPARTLLTEYCGQVYTRRSDTLHQSDNNSIMSLIVTEFAQTSLDIVPVHFGNVARFILGVPQGAARLANVRCLNFGYGGRSRVVFFTTRVIVAGEPLYIDYNDGVFEEYPVDYFTQ